MKIFRAPRDSFSRLARSMTLVLIATSIACQMGFAEENPQGTMLAGVQSADSGNKIPSSLENHVVAFAYPLGITKEQINIVEEESLTLEEVRQIAVNLLPSPLAETAGTTFLRLLSYKVTPMPPRFDASLGGLGTGLSIDYSLWDDHAESRFLDLATFNTGSWSTAASSRTSLGNTELILACVYSISGSEIDIELAGFERDLVAAAFVWKGKGNLDHIESLVNQALPYVESWIAGRELGIMDLKIDPPGSTVSEFSSTSGNEVNSDIVIKGERVFSFSRKQQRVVVQRSTYKDVTLDLEILPLTYSEKRVTLMGIAVPQGSPIAPGFIDRSILKWNQKDEFGKKEKSFQNALGYLVMSIPFSVLGVGSYLMYQEAEMRASGFTTETTIAGAVMGASLTISAACLVYMVVSLSQLMSAAK
jgi:hypothetical protein